MIKRISTIIMFVLLVALAIPAYAANDVEQEVESVNSFELFWPIVAGKTAGDVLYPLKTLKENLRGFFIFASFNKAEYNITLSEKRLVEAEKLILEKDFSNAEKTLSMAKKKRNKAMSYIKKSTSSGIETTNLKVRFISSMEKQSMVLNYLLQDIPEDQKELINQDLEQMFSITEKLK